LSGGHHNHISNDVWMRTVGLGIATIVGGVVTCGALVVGGHFVDNMTGNHVLADGIIIAGWAVLGITLIFGGLYAVAGFANSSIPDEEHDHDDHGHHGSASPIIMAAGVLLFMMGFDGSMEYLRGEPFNGFDTMLAIVGLTIIFVAIGNWWREDLPFSGHGEPKSLGQPFEGQDIRKVGMWIFLMSEMMVFASFFSSYLRMRTGWCTQWDEKVGSACVENGDTIVQVASDLVASSPWTLLPGAINTFALILSSYTIVLALKTAKNMELDADVRNRKVRNYMLATLALGSLFIVLKLVEWGHLIHEGFTVGSVQGSIFYVATGAHGLHVFVGLLIMLYYIFKSDTVGWDEKNAQGIEYFGLYWHFVDLAWVAIFPAFYLY